MRFLASTLYISILLPFLLGWAKNETDHRMKKMQDAAYDTPGAESPLPPQVIIGSMGLIGGHFLFSSGIMKLKKRFTFLTLIVGGLIGVAMFLFAQRESNPSDQ